MKILSLTILYLFSFGLQNTLNAACINNTLFPKGQLFQSSKHIILLKNGKYLSTATTCTHVL